VCATSKAPDGALCLPVFRIFRKTEEQQFEGGKGRGPEAATGRNPEDRASSCGMSSTGSDCSTPRSLLTSFREIEARCSSEGIKRSMPPPAPAGPAQLRSYEGGVPPTVPADPVQLWSYRKQPDGSDIVGAVKRKDRSADKSASAEHASARISTAAPASRIEPRAGSVQEYAGLQALPGLSAKLNFSPTSEKQVSDTTLDTMEVGKNGIEAFRGFPRVEDVCVDTRFLCGHLAMRGSDFVDSSGRTPSDVFLVLLQKDREVTRTPVCEGGDDQLFWDSVVVNVHRDFNVVVQCFEMDVSGDKMIGEANVRAQELIATGSKVRMKRGGKSCGIITVLQSHVIPRTLEDSSVVCMLQEQIFHSEGGGSGLNPEAPGQTVDFARFHIFRVHSLEQRLGVRYSTVNEGLGTAIVDRHFKSTRGVAYFEAGASMSTFDVEIPNDDCWEPIR
jgi:hypothetical protein